MYLNDRDVVDFLIRAKETGLTQGKNGKTGLIFAEENVRESTFFVNTPDSSVTRTHRQLTAIF